MLVTCLQARFVTTKKETSKIRVAGLETKYASLVDDGVPLCFSTVTATRTTTASGSVDCQTLHGVVNLSPSGQSWI